MMWGLLRNRRVLFVAAIVLALLAVALWPQVIEVDAETVARGPLVVTIDEEGETRLHHRFAVSAPVSGRVLIGGALIVSGILVAATAGA